MGKKGRGRPVGFKLSEESRLAISKSKMGQTHSQATKDKISRSLLVYFKQFNSISDDLIHRYCDEEGGKLYSWIVGEKQTIDDLDDVVPERKLRSTHGTEICCGYDIDKFGHGLTPEILVIIKDFVEKHGLDIDKILEEVNY